MTLAIPPTDQPITYGTGKDHGECCRTDASCPFVLSPSAEAPTLAGQPPPPAPPPEPPMPTLSDFCRSYAPEPEHDVRLLLPGFETEEQAEQWRLKRVELLREGGKASRLVADKLDACGGEDGYCLSPACPP